MQCIVLISILFVFRLNTLELTRLQILSISSWVKSTDCGNILRVEKDPDTGDDVLVDTGIPVWADESQTTTEDISKSPFYLAYINFRKKMNFDSFSEEEWKKTFEIERKKTGLRHPEDFE